MGFLMLGCPQRVEGVPDAGSPEPDAGFDAGTPLADAGRTCPDFSHEADGGCVTALFWVNAPTGPSPRDHHATALVAGDAGVTLLVVNGVDMSANAGRFDSWYARPAADGSFDAWHAGPKPLFFAVGSGVEVWNQFVYVVSGSTGAANTPRVQSLQLNDDGTPGTWREEQSLPNAGAFHVTTTRVGRWLFALGGRDANGIAYANVWRAHIEDDGTLSAWSAARSFPAPRTHHASFASGDTLFVTAGFDNQVGFDDANDVHYSDVLTATVDADTGELSEWTSRPLGFELSTHSAAVFDGHVFLVGGFDSEFRVLDTVRRAKVNDDGTLGSFELMAPLIKARAHVHNTPIHAGLIYSVGGNTGGHEPINDVTVGTLY